MENKTETIIIRVTSKEKQLVSERAKEANMTLSQYMLELVKKKRIVVVNNMPQLLSSIYGSATNINQIAKVANTQKFVNQKNVDALLSESAELKEKTNEIISKICEFEPENQIISLKSIYDLLLHINTKLDKIKEDI